MELCLFLFPTHEEAMALAYLKDQAQAAKRAMSEADREVIRLTRALELDRQKAAEAGGGISSYQQRLLAAESSVTVATANHERLNQALMKQKQAMKADPTAQQAEALQALEKSAGKAAEVQITRKALGSATEAHKAHRKAAQENGQTLEQLNKQEKQLNDNISVTESQIKRASEASETYSKSLEKQGHAVSDLDRAEEKHLSTMQKSQRLRVRDESSRALAERARDLRAQAQTSLLFTMSYGYLFTKPLREAIEFEKAMIRVKAMSGASALEFKRLTDDARRLGAETIYTALEVAEAQNELATAGFRPDAIIAIMPHMLDLANSSMTGLARTAEITSEAIQGFNLDVTETKRVGDSLTAAYTGSASSLESLGEMLKYVSSISVDVRSSLEQTLGASSILHNNGIKGSMAGTGLRTFFLRLSDPPKKLKKMLEDMDIHIRDKAGNMRNWIDILHDVNRALEGTGTAVKAAAYKKLGGEEHATTVSKLAAAEKSGALQLEVKKIEMAPAFGALGRQLLTMPDAEIQQIGHELDVKFNRAMSGGGLALSLAGSLKDLKGKAYEEQLQKIFRKAHMAPSLEDARADEYQDQGKRTDDALRRLHIDPKKRAGGMKDNLELTREIKAQLQTLPMQEQLQYIELFFSRTRLGMRRLLGALAPGGKRADELVAGLEDTLTMGKTREGLSRSAATDLEQIQGDFNAIIVSLGNSLLPLLKEYMATIKPYTQAFAKWIDTHQGVARTIMFAIGGLLAFNAAVGLIRFGLSGIVSTFSAGKRIRDFFMKDGLGHKPAKGLWKGMTWAAKKGSKVLRWGGRQIGRGVAIGIELLNAGFWRLIAAAPRIMASLGAVMNVVRALGIALVTTPIGLGITALAIGAILIWRNWSTVGPWLRKTWAQLQVFFTGLFQKIPAVVKFAWDLIMTYMSWRLVDYIIKHWEDLVGFFKNIYEKVLPYIRMMFPVMDSDIRIFGPENKRGILSRMMDSGKSAFSGLLSVESSPPMVPLSMPATEKMASKGSLTQRNIITVNANITVDAGTAAPAQVASKIKGEIQSAFRNIPSFSFIDPVMVS